MSHLVSSTKGAVPVGAEPAPGVKAFSVVVPSADGQVLTSDSSVPAGVKFAAPASAVDPRDIFRFSMIHNVGVTGGG